jgi:hypothetical protein
MDKNYFKHSETEAILANIVPAMIERTVATQYRLCVKKNGDKVLQGAFEWECGSNRGYTWRDIPEVKED